MNIMSAPFVVKRAKNTSIAVENGILVKEKNGVKAIVKFLWTI